MMKIEFSLKNIHRTTYRKFSLRRTKLVRKLDLNIARERKANAEHLKKKKNKTYKEKNYPQTLYVCE